MLSLLTDPHRRHWLLTLLAGAGLAVYVSGSLRQVYGFDVAMLVAMVGGFPIYHEAVASLLKRKISASLAITLAAFAALYLGYAGKDPLGYLTAAEVIFIMLIGESLEHFAIHRTRTGIAALLALRPEEARVRRSHHHDSGHSHEHGHEHHHDHGHHHHHKHDHDHGETHDHELTVPVEDILPDDVVLVRPGDRIPVDGRVLKGSSAVDQSPITGESLPADKTPGDEVFAGTINLYGSMELAVERLGEDTTLEQIIHLVEHAEAAKAPSERLADRYAAWFVPIVLVLAGLTWLVARRVAPEEAVFRAVAVLVVACPCALVLATPTAVAAAIGRMVRRGVLVKGGNVLEQLGKLRAVVFDKTGTLTLAKLRIAELVPAPGEDERELLRLAAAVERHSEHPVGSLIVDRADATGTSPAEAADFTALPGLGARGTVDGATVRVGSPRFFQEEGVDVPPELAKLVASLAGRGCTVVLVGRDGRTIGAVAVEDTLRGEARETIEALRGLGIERVVMLTGDNPGAARSVGDRLGIKDVQAGLLPADKVEAVRKIQRDARGTAMVGDGINDAPSLVTADVGVAMADIGTDVAIASADLVLVGDDLRKLVDAVACGRRMLRVIWQNILWFAVAFNALAVLAASAGWITPVVAALVHQVGSLAVVLNSLRLLVDLHRWPERFGRTRRAVVRRWRWAAAGAIVAGAVAWALSGLFVVRPGEVAVVQRFGRIVGEPEPPGLHWRLPWPMGRHWRVKTAAVRRVEVGFRTTPGSFNEPPAYEWNVQHRGGLFERQDAEAGVLAGDETLVDVNLVVHYRVTDPVAAIFTVGPTLSDGSGKWDVLVRDVAEAALREEMSGREADAILAEARAGIESSIRGRIEAALGDYATGFAVESVCLGDVHPPVEVVPAFREVASSTEEKEATINQAHGVSYETVASARGEAAKSVLTAEAEGTDRTQKAQGRAERFTAVATAYGRSREVTSLRLYLEMIESALAGRRKVILDKTADGSRRQLYLGGEGLLRAAPLLQGEPPQGAPPEEFPRPEE